MDFQGRTFQPSPRESAGFFSKLFFTWTLPIFRKGRKTKLGIDDLYRLIPADASEKLGDKFLAKWEANVLKAKEEGKNPSLIWTLSEIYRRWYLLLVIPILIDSGIMGVILPICVRLFIKSFNESENMSSNERYLYAVGILMPAFYRTMIIQLCNFKFFHIAMRIRVALSTAIYRKVLRLSRSGQDTANIGHVINLFTNDIYRFDMTLVSAPFFVASPLVLVTCGYVLWLEIGVAAFAGIGAVLILAPIQYFAGSYSAVLRHKVATRTDKRAKLMSELIAAMRVIKMYAWEKPFSALIHALRGHEMIAVTNRLYVRALFSCIFRMAHRVVMLVTLITYVWTGETLTAEKVFFASSIFIKIVHCIILVLPNAFADLGEVFVAAKRIQNFLLLDDDINQLQTSQNMITAKPETPEKSENEASVVLENVFACWAGAYKQTLSNINCSITGNKLLMIVGEVGAGKTSILNVLIGELGIMSGSCTINGETCYASQEPWIFSGTIRQNIIFGRPYEEASYWPIIEACALNYDLKNWEHGDMTRVGERGVTLSGGQKARISLARVLYTNSNICLLDDILSAVDAKVSRHLFEKCIMGLLKDKLRIVVTHQLQYLPFADHIIVLEDGCIQAQGPLSELQKENIDLVNLLNVKHDAGTALHEENVKTERELIDSEPKGKVNKSASKSNGKEIEEEMNTGKVTFRTYWKYFHTADSTILMVVLAVGLLAIATASSFCDYWLSYWTNSIEHQSHSDKGFNTSSNASYSFSDSDLEFSTYMFVYSGSVAFATIGFLTITLLFFRFGLKIGVNIHDRMFRSLVRAPIHFFDRNPSGRIMNRFTHDMGALDEFLVVAMYDTISVTLQSLFIFLLISILNPVLIIPTILIICALCMMRQHYIPTSRALKRIDAITKSPCLTHLTATYQGLSTVRALRAQGVLIKQFCAQLDINSCCWYQLFSTGRWFAIWLDLIVVMYLAVVVISFCIFSSGDGTGGTVGLAVTSALMMMSTFQWAIRQSTATESYMTSVERLLEYISTPSEAPLESRPECKPGSDWPQKGHVRFDSVSLTYGDTAVLKNISFEVTPRQKIGIIGRTGAGKSSIIAALLRMVEPEGEIYIDAVRVRDIGLNDLRQSISIIPQDPQLFSGTVRYNLDPFDKYEDSELWQAIEDVEMKDAIPTLDFMVCSGGSNFSVGQRQLMCLARAILRKNCILVSDEATANVDERTDELIQATIREKFESCTIITIAHRLNTVMDCDKILVLENGSVMEYDEARILLENRNSYLSLMVEQAGKENKDLHRVVAAKVYSD